MTKLNLDEYKNYLQYEKRYPETTINSYLNALTKYDEFINESNINYKTITKEEIRNFIMEKADNGLRVLGFFKDDKLIGFLSYEIKEMVNKYLWIDEFMITESERKKGYGTLLMNKAKEIAEKEKVKRIALNVYAFNENALKLYKKLGYLEERYVLEMFLED